MGTATSPLFYLEIPPFLFATVVKNLRQAGLTRLGPHRGGKAVRQRPDLRARAGRRAPRVPRRVADSAHRPLPRQDGAGGDPVLCASPTRCSSHSGIAIMSTMSRSRWPRTLAWRTAATSTIRSARYATWSSITSCRSSRRRPWRRQLAATRTRCRIPAGRLPIDPAGQPGPLRARPVRRLSPASTVSRRTRRPRRIPRCGSTSRTGAGRASRSSSARGKRLPVTQTEVRLVFKHPPRLGFGLDPLRTTLSISSSSSSIPRRACR